MLQVLALFITSLAMAAPIPNISGVVGRLEVIVCNGAQAVKASAAGKVYQKAELACGNIPAESIDACFEEVVKQNTTFVESSFRGAAIQNTKQFKMNITSKAGKTLFSSIREGYHGDTNNNGIVLYFNRAGVSGDEFVIETGPLSKNGRSVPSLIVPVKKRLVSDEVYFFFDCALRWIY